MTCSQADADHGRPHQEEPPHGDAGYRDTLTAAAVTNLGGVLAQTTASADAAGYQQLLEVADRHVVGRRRWAVEERVASALG